MVRGHVLDHSGTIGGQHKAHLDRLPGVGAHRDVPQNPVGIPQGRTQPHAVSGKHLRPCPAAIGGNLRGKRCRRGRKPGPVVKPQSAVSRWNHTTHDHKRLVTEDAARIRELECLAPGPHQSRLPQRITGRHRLRHLRRGRVLGSFHPHRLIGTRDFHLIGIRLADRVERVGLPGSRQRRRSGNRHRFPQHIRIEQPDGVGLAGGNSRAGNAGNRNHIGNVIRHGRRQPLGFPHDRVVAVAGVIVGHDG